MKVSPYLLATLLMATAAWAEDADIEFKPSHFAEKLKEKLGSGKPSAPALPKLAQEVLEKEGLPYKAHLKKTSHVWSICSTMSASDSVCQSSTVSFSGGDDHCGKFGEFGVLAQSATQWVLTTGNTPFRVPIADVILPVTLVLQKSEAIVRSWVLPQNFSAAFLTQDLRTLLLKTDVSGVSFYLEVRESGRVHFVAAPSDLAKFITLTDKTYQEVKNLEGVRYQLMLPKNCI